jgi:hypothetical protein
MLKLFSKTKSCTFKCLNIVLKKLYGFSMNYIQLVKFN